MCIRNRNIKIKYIQKSAQSFLEYSFMIAAVVGALIAMQNYLNRSYQGKLKESVDGMGGESLGAGFRGPGASHSQASSSYVKRSAWAVTYEDKRGYTVEVGGSGRSEISSLKGIVLPVDVPGNIGELSEEELRSLESGNEAQARSGAEGLSDSSFNDPGGGELEGQYGGIE